jgi:hypothetical protein
LFLLDEISLKSSGGEGGIRTPGTRKRSTVFKTAAFNHSATSPWPLYIVSSNKFNQKSKRWVGFSYPHKLYDKLYVGSYVCASSAGANPLHSVQLVLVESHARKVW